MAQKHVHEFQLGIKVILFFFWCLADQRSIGSDSQGRVTAANNQRQLAGENRKPSNYLPLHVNTNRSKEPLQPSASASAPPTPAVTKETKKQRETLSPGVPHKESARMSRGGADRGLVMQRDTGRQESKVDSSQVMLVLPVVYMTLTQYLILTTCSDQQSFHK